MKKKYILFLFLAGLSYLYSQDIEVKASVDVNKIMIGDWIKLDLFVKHSKDIQVTWPKLEDVLGSFEIVMQDSLPKIEEKKADKIESLGALISVYDSGYYQIPAIQFFYYSTLDTVQRDLFTNPIDIHVTTLAVDTNLPIKDIKDVMDIPIPLFKIFQYICIVIFVILLIYSIWERFKRKKISVEVVVKKKPEKPPHEIAFAELNLLNDKKLWQQGLVREYYTEVTEIIRRYIENRYLISAMEMTTSEIVNSIVNVQNDTKIQEVLKMFLNLADYVKFAKFQPSNIEHEDEMKRAYSFIDNTKLLSQEHENKEPETNDSNI
jgi:hypothetical protein